MSDNIKNTSQDNTQEPQVDETVSSQEVVEEATVENVSQEPTSEIIEEVKIGKSSDDAFGFRAGDTVRVHYKIIEGNKTRIQPYEGIVIARKGKEKSKTFTVRRIGADNVGVERIFPLFSPNIVKIDLVKRGKVRRSKLYYLREKIGREAMRIKELGK